VYLFADDENLFRHGQDCRIGTSRKMSVDIDAT